MNDLSLAAQQLSGQRRLDAPSCWEAFLHLGIASTARGSRLLTSSHDGPLYVQKPFYPEGADLAHVYILHPPGGLVSGDNLDIQITAGEASRALFTTPGAGRVYRARADIRPQRQQVQLRLEQDSSIEWLPLETIVYPGACGQLCTHIDLADNSQFIGWEITCLGLPASGEPFERGQFNQRLQIFRQGQPLLVENLPLKAADTGLMHSAIGLGGNSVLGLLVAGPVSAELAESLLESLRDIAAPVGALLAVTYVSGFLLVRYLGNCGFQARALLTAAWRILRPAIIGRPACDPRIWAC